jgi:ribose 5-phosphate isomerase B
MAALRIIVASDHAGFDLKNELAEGLRDLKYEVTDIGATSTDPTDFPDFAHAAALGVQAGKFDRAILVDGTGVGMAITANRYRGVRAANCGDVFSSRYSRAHHDANVLALGARVLGVGLAWEIVNVWLQTPFSGGDRHVRRLGKIEPKSGNERG